MHQVREYVYACLFVCVCIYLYVCLSMCAYICMVCMYVHVCRVHVSWLLTLAVLCAWQLSPSSGHQADASALKVGENSGSSKSLLGSLAHDLPGLAWILLGMGSSLPPKAMEALILVLCGHMLSTRRHPTTENSFGPGTMPRFLSSLLPSLSSLLFLYPLYIG